MICLSEGVSGNGKAFIEVASVSPPMRGLTVPPASHELFGFLLGLINSTKDTIEIPTWVPRLYGRNVIDDIRVSKEYLALPNF
jgi:hypothetical protein